MGSLISIITPSFNSENYIADTIKSILSQDFHSWELIVADDASTDNTVEIVKAYASNDKRINLIQSNINSGPGPARNMAIERAKGRYIAFLDSDDLWYSDKLTKQLEFMQNKNATMSFTSYEVINMKGNLSNKVVRAPEILTYSELMKNTVIGCLTVMVDRNKFSDLKMPDISSRQPLVVWLRILKTGRVAFGLDKILAKYRVVKGSVSHDKLKAAKNVWHVYRNFENLTFYKSCYYFFHYSKNGFLRNKNRIF